MAEFDVDAARKSGASDDEILSYLSKRSPNFDVEGALRSTPKADVIKYLSTNSAPPKPVETTTTMKAAPKEWTVPWLKEKLYNVADSLTEGLPAAGATAGAMIGAGTGAADFGTTTVPGAIGGAGIGGMAGEALKQHVRRALGFEVPQTSEEAAKEITKQGVIQGGVQAVTEGLPMLAGPLKSAAVKQYTKALRPLGAENKTIAQEAVPEMIQRGIHGSTEQMEEQAGKQIAGLRPQVNQAYAAVPQGATAAQSPVTNTLKSLEGMKGKYVVDGQVVNPQAVNAINGVQDIIEKHANGISPQSLRKIKQIFDEAVSEAGGYTNADLTTNYSLKAQRESANQIRSMLHKAGPDAAAADKEISFWLDVNQLARAKNLTSTGQEGGLLKTFRPMAAASAGALGLTHSTEGGLAAATSTYVATRLAEAMRTPAWRTASAVAKDRLANALTSGDTRLAIASLARLGATIPANWEKQVRATLPEPTPQ